MWSLEQILAVGGIAVGAYLIGSVNLSILATRLLGYPDPRKGGSGNPGATNLLRMAGWHVAVPVALLDIAKASGAILLAKLLGPAELAPTMVVPLLLGNIFPAFHRFRGGKGVAAAFGAFLVIAPLSTLLGGAVFIAIVAVLRKVSLSSIVMVASYTPLIWLLDGNRNAALSALLIAFIILYTHRANIRRLARGKEPSLGQKKEPGK